MVQVEIQIRESAAVQEEPPFAMHRKLPCVYFSTRASADSGKESGLKKKKKGSSAVFFF